MLEPKFWETLFAGGSIGCKTGEQILSSDRILLKSCSPLVFFYFKKFQIKEYNLYSKVFIKCVNLMYTAQYIFAYM